MKLKHVIWVFSAVVGIATMAAGVAVLVNRFFGGNVKSMGYIECDCKTDEE